MLFHSLPDFRDISSLRSPCRQNRHQGRMDAFGNRTFKMQFRQVCGKLVYLFADARQLGTHVGANLLVYFKSTAKQHLRPAINNTVNEMTAVLEGN